MFYSHCLLSRKGPLGTVWIAAHCHRKLRKDQVTETDICSSVDKIILAEVSVAYRVLGFLLLGIVRIYSKKVDYLYHDCNNTLSTIRRFSSLPINLEQDATVKPYHSITLPKRFELDAFDLEMEDLEDGYVKTQEHITLEDMQDDGYNQFHSHNQFDHRGMFVEFEFDSVGFTPIEGYPSHLEMDIHTDINELDRMNNTFHPEISIEKLRTHQLPIEENLAPLILNPVEEISGRSGHNEDEEQAKLSDIILPDLEKYPLPDEVTPVSKTPARISDRSNHPFVSGELTPEFKHLSTPNKGAKQQISKKRKCFDEIIVLSNEVLRENIHDASSLIKKRKKAPHTFLDAWKLYRISNLEESFFEPIILGTSFKLKALFQRNNYDHKESESFADVTDTDKEEIRTPKRSETSNKIYAEYQTQMESSSPVTPNSGSFQEEIQTPNLLSSTNVSFEKDGDILTQTPISHETYEKNAQILSLNAFEQDLTLVKEVDGEDECHSEDGWSSRTRSVAKFLSKRLIDQDNRESVEGLSLGCVVKGASRAKCARFFYEVLVLKTKDCIDVRQNAPYDDVLLIGTSHLKELF